MSSFFTLPASQRKRKREDRTAAPTPKKRGVTTGDTRETGRGRGARDRDESISGSESEDDEGLNQGLESEDEGSASESEGDETGAERRLRLAERYLENVREEVDEVGFDAAEIDRDLIAERLKEDVEEAKGTAYRKIASQLSFSKASHAFFRADTQSTTAIALHPPYVFTVSKDKTLIKWELAPPPPSNTSHSTAANGVNGSSKRPPRPLRKKPKNIRFARGLRNSESGAQQGHVGHILTVAVSPSGKFVATGGADRRLIIWDVETLTPLKTFTHHRDSVSRLSFTRHISSGSSGEQMFSASFDRTIKTWSLSPGSHAYIETLFGHQDHVVSVASMSTDQCVSVGARDRTARLWKVVDEAQLVFRGGSNKHSHVENNLDCVATLPPTHFVTGSDSGSLCLWSVHKKKPLHTIPLAHGLDPLPKIEDLSAEIDPSVAEKAARSVRQSPRWITALATVPGTDVVLSGSWDGWIRAWRISEDKKYIIPIGPVGAHDPASLVLNKKLTFDDNGDASAMEIDQDQQEEASTKPLLNGIVNDIAVFERRGTTASTKAAEPKSKKNNNKEGKDTSTPEPKGLCIVAALGKEHRLGRWKRFGDTGDVTGGKNGAVVFEVPFSADIGEGGLENGVVVNGDDES
ncbi:pre-rRNA processing protein [Arachnomyces sp. PD_36]|nr:pre-rRNA processing protein [Arachnomyces sp. PD_36]